VSGGNRLMSGSTSTHAPGPPVGDAHAAGGGTGAGPEAVASFPGVDGSRVPVPPCHHGHDLERWPLRDALILGAVADAVPSARAHLRQLLAEWGRDELGPDAGVVVSELVTNAVAASGQLSVTVAPVLVWLVSDSHWLLVAVADASPLPPLRLNLEPAAEYGRGLALVEAFSSRWGWHPVNVAGLVKVVWAEWRLPSRPGQQPAVGLPGRCHAL
jgi:anti-sigma regulatory factor (Ser/Thr protein kinase)